MNFIAPSFFTLLYAGLCLLAFGWVYERWMHRESFYQANRFYLLLTPFLAVLIPHLQFEVVLEPDPGAAVMLLEQSQQLPSELLRLLFPQPSANLLSWGTLLLMMYLTGAGLVVARSLWNFSKIWYWIKHGKITPMGNWRLVQQARIPEAASFFNYVFWNNNQPIPSMVLQHELIHVQQGHSWDVVLMEIWIALHWFNPYIYRLRQRLQETHEFIADAGVIEAQGSKYNYACLLASQKQKLEQMPYNTFAAQLSARLRRMTQNSSPQWKAIQYALCLPLVLSLGMFFSVNFLQALPSPLSNQSIGQVVKEMEQAPVLIAESQRTAQADSKTTVRMEMINPSEFARDTTPKTITVTVDGSNKDGLKIKGASTKVLVVVDGVKIGPMGEEGSGPLSKINPSDILTVNVSKDGSAVAKYGEEACEGVIEIITKANKNLPETTVNINTNVNTNVNSEIKVNVTTDSKVEEKTTVTFSSGEGEKVQISQSNLGGTPLIIKNGKILGRMNFEKSGKPLKNLNPKYIKSINVIKGKAAIEKYGKDAEDGAIEIEIKRH
ncbi:TonB-dependent receptor plug domain-containing protein [Haliscomenobacter sp.]|uniref:M56 family metallopeptidase n=1 Tax=Haliscomenobacter sp. TaxID=2717303 RepID=UPI003364B76C